MTDEQETEAMVKQLMHSSIADILLGLEEEGEDTFAIKIDFSDSQLSIYISLREGVIQ